MMRKTRIDRKQTDLALILYIAQTNRQLQTGATGTNN